MDELHSLLHSLTSAEWHSFQNYLTCFTSHEPSRVKCLQLAEILMNEKNAPSHDGCCIKLYGRKKDHGFDELKSALKEKTLDFLLTDISGDKKQELDEADYAIVKMHKMAAQFQQLFYSKRRISLMAYLLEDIINIAKEYERFTFLIEYLRYKKNMISWKKSRGEFERINSEMEDATRASALSNKAEHFYYMAGLMDEYSGKPNPKEKLSFLIGAITEIKGDNETIKSALVNYNLKALEMEYYHMQNDYEKTRSTCLEWLNLVRFNKSVYRRQRVGIVYDHLSRCEYYLKNYKLAVESAQHAQKHFNLNSENYCIALEQEFYALFAMKEYGKAADIAGKMISFATRKELGEFRFAKYNYLLANTLFKLKRFTEALNLLSQEMEISKDKTGWEVGVRTLKIMVLVETGKYNEAELSILALKEFIKYTDKKVQESKESGKEVLPISKRDRIILNMLMQAQRKGFAFNLLNIIADENLVALSSSPNSQASDSPQEPSRTELSWQPFTHEVIPFHEWFAEKMGRRKTTGVVSKRKQKVVPKAKEESASSNQLVEVVKGK